LEKPLQFTLFSGGAQAPTLRDVANAVREAGVESLPDARERADRARYQEVHVRSAMAKAVGMPFRWALNPYRGCTHACEYCYARKYQRHLELGPGDDFSSLILVKRNLPEVLRHEVGRRTWTRETVAIGTATDPYQPIEGHYRLTRRCLEVLVGAATPFSIVTKGPMVVRDLDVLKRAARGSGCQVCVSVPSVDEEAWSKLEPGTAPPLQRIRAVRQLAEAGIEAGVLMMPLVPGITTTRSSIERTLEAIAAAGVAYLGSNVARFDDGVRGHFFGFLAREYPALVEGYTRLYPRAYARRGYVDRIKMLVKDLRAKGRLKPAPPPNGSGPADGEDPADEGAGFSPPSAIRTRESP
jgi:DNA repair photolyase